MFNGSSFGCIALAMMAVLVVTRGAGAAPLLVEAGKARATIVISDKPQRMARLAAEELQAHVRLMTGAELPIASSPSADHPLAIYVGRSAHTDKLGIVVDGLDDGAFRMVSGENWLALIGRDTDFVPPEPWAGSPAQIPAMLEAWDKLTGETWDNPVGAPMWRKLNKKRGLWAYDERGSLNAVYRFLRDQGVEWYMPGDLGMIVPQKSDIELPRTDATVVPQFGLRYQHHTFFAMAEWDDMLWYLRLGLNSHSSAVGDPLIHSHGMGYVHSRPEVRAAHPEYFAIWGGKRMTEGEGKPCLSSQGLFEQNVKYLRAMFDIYHLPMASLFPPDGYGSICQCSACKDLGTPERGHNGSMSDYVWAYVDKVAREVLKTHPDRKISCFAYGSYLLPPTRISRLSPNLVVGIVQPRREFHNEKTRARYVDMRKAWLDMADDGKLIIWDHYPFTLPGRPSHGMPQYFPHAIAKDLQSLKGISYGELLEVMFDPKRGMGLHAPAFNHLNVFVTARMYWDADQDVNAMLDTYYQRFYGPVASEMKTFVEFCEANLAGLRTDPAVITEMLRLIGVARDKVDPQTAYGQRVAQLVEYLEPSRHLRDRLAVGRKNSPEARVAEVKPAPADIALDGRLDEQVWQDQRRVFGMAEIQTGQRATFQTSFRMFWANNSLYIGVRCEDPDADKLNIATTSDNDMNIFAGDAIELLLETDVHSYYQIVINPAGAVVDLDRISGINSLWTSQAEVASHVGEGYWSVEMRLPVVAPDAGQLDPLHNVIGSKPTPTHPWYFNLCRQRVRDSGMERSAFSPTAEDNFHVLLKFAKLYVW